MNRDRPVRKVVVVDTDGMPEAALIGDDPKC